MDFCSLAPAPIECRFMSQAIGRVIEMMRVPLDEVFPARSSEFAVETRSGMQGRSFGKI